MSILLTSLGVAGGFFLARAVARAFRRDGRDDGAPGEVGPAAGARDGGASPFATFPCKLGDVILAHAGDEAWLAGALVFRERLPMAALFIAPDAGGDRAVYVRPLPQLAILWLRPVPPGSIALGREPPSALEIDRERFDRVRRIPYRVERVGTGAPDVGEEVVLAEYAAPNGDRALVLSGGAGARAYRGRPLEEGTYEILPGKDPAEV